MEKTKVYGDILYFKINGINTPIKISNDMCPECFEKSFITDHNTGDKVCKSCGLVHEERLIEHSQEWRSFTFEDYNTKTRVGAPFTLTIHDKGLSTMIDWRDKDAAGRPLSAAKRVELYRLRKWNSRMRIHTSTDRNLAFAMSELDRMSSQLNCSKTIKENAAIFYRKAIDLNLIRGRSIEAMICACLYAACRISRLPLSLEDFEENSRICKKDIGRCYRLVLKELKIKIPNLTAKNFIPKFTNELKLSENVAQKANEILRKAKCLGFIAGKDPTGLAAAAIYIASLMTGEKRTQKEIALIANITEVTVRNRYKDLNQQLNLNVYPDH